MTNEAAARESMSEFYNTEKLDGKYHQTNKPVMDKDGATISAM
jgi:hypothetical protein